MENQKIPEIIHSSWHELIQSLLNNPKMIMLKTKILPTQQWYPQGKDVFRVFEMPIDNIRVVILGQDPYIKGEAIGYAFAVDKDTIIPPSLKVIQKEIINSEVITHECITTKEWKELAHWREQGIFLLNAALTVEAGNSKSHTQLWEWFTKQVISYIASKRNLIWLLWGSQAQSYQSYIPNSLHIKDETDADAINPTQGILKAYHPAAETYPDSKYKFTGCNHFVMCNILLAHKDEKPIKW